MEMALAGTQRLGDGGTRGGTSIGHRQHLPSQNAVDLLPKHRGLAPELQRAERLLQGPQEVLGHVFQGNWLGGVARAAAGAQAEAALASSRQQP